jgi:hypothetical protein
MWGIVLGVWLPGCLSIMNVNPQEQVEDSPAMSLNHCLAAQKLGFNPGTKEKNKLKFSSDITLVRPTLHC